MDTFSLRDVIDSGVGLTSLDAVAVVQQLIRSYDHDSEPMVPQGPPTLDNVLLSGDGVVRCAACLATPAVSEIAGLLDALLPRGGTTRVPGALRYLIARARLEVDVPPFDSIRDLSDVLSRHEQGQRADVLRSLHARATTALRAAQPQRPVDRRAGSPAVAELRRQLRSADQALFEGQAIAAEHEIPPVASVPVAPMPAPTPPRWAHGVAWPLAGALAGLLSFAAGYAVVAKMQARPAIMPQAARLTSSPRPATVLSAALVAPWAPAPIAPPRPRTMAVAEPAVVRAVFGSAGPTFSPSFASDGTALFFHSGRSADGRSAIESASVGGDDLRVMTIVDDGARNYHVQPSPDGAQVAFDSDRDGERGVYVANRDGTDVHRVSGPGYAAVPSWSPDARSLGYIRAEADRPRVWNLWLLTLESGESRRITAFRFGQTWGGSWFPDGQRIAYTHEDRLVVRNLATAATKEYPSPVSNRLVRTPAVSPDGRHIIYQVARTGAWLLDLQNGSTRCVLADPTAEEFAWSPDGRRVAFHSRRDGQWGIWLMTPG